MRKHTQLKWKLSINPHWKTNPFSVIVQGGGVHSTTIANIPSRRTIPMLEQEANARLITAAPDLLDALVTMPQGMSSTDQEWWDWIDKARSAINKATGESNA